MHIIILSIKVLNIDILKVKYELLNFKYYILII